VLLTGLSAEVKITLDRHAVLSRHRFAQLEAFGILIAFPMEALLILHLLHLLQLTHQLTLQPTDQIVQLTGLNAEVKTGQDQLAAKPRASLARTATNGIQVASLLPNGEKFHPWNYNMQYR
jgi:hypothetical protein